MLLAPLGALFSASVANYFKNVKVIWDIFMVCTKNHRFDPQHNGLPEDQGGVGRHKCAGCAYDKGYEDGLIRKEQISIDLNLLPDSQAGTVRHKSPHAAYAQGYLDGVRDSYR